MIKNCLIAEDHPLTTTFLRTAVLSAFSRANIFTVESLSKAKDWIEEYEKQTIPLDLALIDLGLPDGSGLELLRFIKSRMPNTKLVVITIFDDDAHLFEALGAGATGYILKEEDPHFLVDILKRIERDEPPLSPSIARRLLEHFQKMGAPNGSNQKPAELTAREKETLTFLARGLTVAEAAKEMGLSAQTVASYVKIIYQKLHVTNRAEATRAAIKRGLV